MRRILVIALLLLTLQACSSPDGSPAPAANTGDASTGTLTTLEQGVWPVNSYTGGLPAPSGTVSWWSLDEEHGSCTINLTDLQETDYADYMECLQQEGFSVVEHVSEEIKGQNGVSDCSLLSNEEKSLSISYLSNNFTIYITFEN